MNRIQVFIGVLCATACAQAAAEVFKWVDKDGAVHYGDRPPDNGPAQQVNSSLLPLALQERLRSLDSYFIITKFGGNLSIGWVCGEFDPDSAGAPEPRFPAQVESANLGSVKPDQVATAPGQYTTQYQLQYRGSVAYGTTPQLVYQAGKCGWPAQRDPHLQRRVYEIRFNADAVRAYHDANAR